jgi:site-specific recombinase XerD
MLILTQTELEITISEYVVDCRARGLSQRTVNIYSYHLRRLAVWLAGRGVVDVSQINRLLLREWAAGLWDHWQAATIKGAVTAARSWLRWCRAEGIIECDLAAVLKVPTQRLTLQRTVTPIQMLKLISVCDLGTAGGCRDAALVSLLFDSGLRAAEAARVRFADVDLDDGILQVRVKGGAVAPAAFGGYTTGRIRDWLGYRATVARVDAVELFVSVGGITAGYGLTSSGLGNVVRRLGRRAGIAVSPHDFRRGFACALADAGVPDTTLSKLGRWSNTQQIRRYTQAQEVRRSYISPLDLNSGT